MLTTVMARAGQATAPYTANAVDFDGTNDYMLRGGLMTGLADSKVGTLSLWIRVDAGDGALARVYSGHSAANRFQVQKQAANTMRVVGADSGGVVILNMITTSAYTATTAWRHFLAAWNLATPVGYLYTNDADDLAAGGTFTDALIDFDAASNNWAVGAADDGTTKINACLAECWFTTTFIDISVAANRAKFINPTTLKPVSLGADGSLPTGTAPILYLANPAASFQTNLGTGGDFTVTGTLTAASTSPSD